MSCDRLNDGHIFVNQGGGGYGSRRMSLPLFSLQKIQDVSPSPLSQPGEYGDGFNVIFPTTLDQKDSGIEKSTSSVNVHNEKSQKKKSRRSFRIDGVRSETDARNYLYENRYNREWIVSEAGGAHSPPIFRQILTFLRSKTDVVKSYFSNLFYSDAFGSFGKAVSVTESDDEYAMAQTDLPVIEGASNDGVKELPGLQIGSMALVSQWLEKSPVNYHNLQNESSKNSQCNSYRWQDTTPDNFNVLEMNMANYSKRRSHGDTKVYVGRHSYLVDSCFLQAQSRKFRNLLYWGNMGEYENSYIPYIRLNDVTVLEFEAMMVYMYTGGELLPQVTRRDGKGPTRRFMDILKNYEIPFVR